MKIVDSGCSTEYTDLVDWILSDEYPNKQENANRITAFGWFKNAVAEEIIKNYTLNKFLPKEVSKAHIDGFIHIHDLGTGFFVKYCAGWSLPKLLQKGFGGVPNIVESKPPKHFSSALGQIVNFLGVVQNEGAGAQAVNSIDTLLSPYVYYDKLSYRDVKQAIQEFVFNLNVTIRWGSESLFSNVSFDLVPPDDLANTPVVIGGEVKDKCYGDFQEQIDMINKAFLEVLLEGDGKGTPFSFPIPTYSITSDFPWDSEIGELLSKVAVKWGSPYFMNCINSGIKPSDVRSMCCRLQLDLNEIRNVTGGLFGSSDETGSIGVVTVNLPKLAYLAKSEDEFFDLLDYYLDIAKNVLELKRKLVTYYTYEINPSMSPYTKIYLRGYETFFNTIGIVGGHEACMNILGVGIDTPDGKNFMIKVLTHIRQRTEEFKQETGHLFNLEATPAEGCSYRLARIDKMMYKDIVTSGTSDAPYYTNSTHLPVSLDIPLHEALKHQEDLQSIYTGGTVFHIYLGETPPFNVVGRLIDKICRKTKLPYITLTPTYSKCPKHGYIPGKHWKCPYCGSECLVYSRITGYYRPIQNWNAGKQQEFRERRFYNIT